MRRVRTLSEQGQLFDTWQCFAFATIRTEPLEVVESEQRCHALVELYIRDLKDQALCHFPSGYFNANSAWCVIAALAHNLGRWTSVLGLPERVPRTAAGSGCAKTALLACRSHQIVTQRDQRPRSGRITADPGHRQPDRGPASHYAVDSG